MAIAARHPVTAPVVRPPLRMVPGIPSGRPVGAASGVIRAPTARSRRASGAVYRRRRILVAAVALVLAAALGAAAATAVSPLRDRGGPASPAPHRTEGAMIVVGPGDTIWDLVLPHAPAGADPVAFAARVAADNGVDPRAVQPGTVVRVPRS